MRTQAYIDRLTGIGNRAAYEDHVQAVNEEIAKGTAAFAVAVFDLNGLKEINDQYGHTQGDQAIINVSSVLGQVFQEAKLYRLGGDEFAVITEAALSDLPSKMREIDGLLGILVSKGYSAFDPDSDFAFSDVFNRADNEMYEDKRKYYQAHRDRRRK